MFEQTFKNIDDVLWKEACCATELDYPSRLRGGAVTRFVDLPANVNHYAFVNVETVIQIAAEGPFGIKYRTLADDPSK